MPPLDDTEFQYPTPDADTGNMAIGGAVSPPPPISWAPSALTTPPPQQDVAPPDTTPSPPPVDTTPPPPMARTTEAPGGVLPDATGPEDVTQTAPMRVRGSKGGASALSGNDYVDHEPRLKAPFARYKQLEQDQPTLYEAINHIADDVGVPRADLAALIYANSDDDPNAKSGNRIGYMGITPADQAKYDPDGHLDPNHPLDNIWLGAKKYLDLSHEYGFFTPETLAAYHSGEPVVNSLHRHNQSDHRSIAPPGMFDFVNKVVGRNAPQRALDPNLLIAEQRMPPTEIPPVAPPTLPPDYAGDTGGLTQQPELSPDEKIGAAADRAARGLKGFVTTAPGRLASTLSDPAKLGTAVRNIGQGVSSDVAGALRGASTPADIMPESDLEAGPGIIAPAIGRVVASVGDYARTVGRVASGEDPQKVKQDIAASRAPDDTLPPTRLGPGFVPPSAPAAVDPEIAYMQPRGAAAAAPATPTTPATPAAPAAPAALAPAQYGTGMRDIVPASAPAAPAPLPSAALGPAPGAATAPTTGSEPPPKPTVTPEDQPPSAGAAPPQAGTPGGAPLVAQPAPQTSGATPPARPTTRDGPITSLPGGPSRMTPQGAVQAAATGGPNGVLTYMSDNGRPGATPGQNWNSFQRNLMGVAAMGGSVDDIIHAHQYVFTLQHAGAVQNLQAAWAAFDTDKQAAASLLARSHAFFNDGSVGGFQVINNQIVGQRFDENTHQPLGSPFAVTKQGILDMAKQVQDPAKFQSLVDEEKKTNETIAHNIQDEEHNRVTAAETGRHNIEEEANQRAYHEALAAQAAATRESREAIAEANRKAAMDRVKYRVDNANTAFNKQLDHATRVEGEGLYNTDDTKLTGDPPLTLDGKTPMSPTDRTYAQTLYHGLIMYNDNMTSGTVQDIVRSLVAPAPGQGQLDLRKYGLGLTSEVTKTGDPIYAVRTMPKPGSDSVDVAYLPFSSIRSILPSQYRPPAARPPPTAQRVSQPAAP